MGGDRHGRVFPCSSALQAMDGAADVDHVEVVGGRECGSDEVRAQDQTRVLPAGLVLEQMESTGVTHLAIGADGLQHCVAS